MPESDSSPPINRVIAYVKNVPKVAAFYERHFGMLSLPGSTESWTELSSPSGGCILSLHKAAVSQKSKASMKLVFRVADVRAFKAAKEKEGLKFGVVHHVRKEGHEFSNAKDPAGNSISISSRGISRNGAE